MRVFLLRLLIGWWMIPFTYMLFPALGWLIYNDFNGGVEDARFMATKLWGTR